MTRLEIYLAGIIAFLLTCAGAYFYGHHVGYQAEKVEFDKFVAKTEALGIAAQAKADQQKADDKLAKEKADATNAQTVTALAATITGLRNSRPAGNLVPAAPAGSKRPDLICFDREAYKSAYGGLVKDLRGIADEGTAATVNLDTAKLWAQRPTK